MLQVYRRHYPPCPHHSRSFRRCKCPVWVQGTLRGERVRRSLDVESVEEGERLVAQWREAGEIGEVKEVPVIKVAVADFLKDAETRQLSPSSISKLKVLLNRQLLPWAESQGYRYLRQLDVPTLRMFRATWKDAPISALKKLERLRSFFRFCVQSGWLKHNPCLSIKPPKVKASPTLPFTENEMEKILEGCEKFPIQGRAKAVHRDRMKALVLLLRHSGLRISDGVFIDKSRFNGSLLRLYTAKTGTHVSVPLPPKAMKALETVDFRFVESADVKPKHIVGSFQRSFRRMDCGVDNIHAHRFRDTFAVELLKNGVPIFDVSILLGHSSVKITEKHYAPHVKERQDRLEAAVRKTWT